MQNAELAAYAHAEGQAMDNGLGRITYRCAAHLTDGVYLPCVVLASAEAHIDLAIRRFEETLNEAGRWISFRRSSSRQGDYRHIVQAFVASGNRLNHFDIARVEPSPFAIPLERLAEVQGETSMAWTQFAATMQDGREFSFGTTYSMEFFQMPTGYTGRDVTTIISHKRAEGELYRERPFFTCFVEGL